MYNFVLLVTVIELQIKIRNFAIFLDLGSLELFFFGTT